MFPLTKFRIGCESSIKESMKQYIITNFSNAAFKQCENFVNEFYQTRNMVGFMNSNQTSPDKINNMISNCFKYLKSLEILNDKIKIGSESNCLQIKFSWKEASCNKETSSFNIYYEICSVKFNIAIAYCLLAYLDFKTDNQDLLKESMKNFERASYLFKEIKKTAKGYLAKENIPDFSESFLNCCSDYALSLAQICVLKIAELKNLSKALMAKLSMGTYTLLDQCMNYSITAFSCDKTLPKFLRSYFEAKAYIYKKDFLLIDYDKYAKGLGDILGYTQLGLQKLNECAKDLMKVKSHFEEFRLTNEKSDLEFFFQKYSTLNNKLDREKITEENKLAVIEGDIKVKPLEVDFNTNPIPSISIINKCLIPNNIKPFVNRYFEEIALYLNTRLSEFESDESISKFLENRNLPNALKTGVSSNTISQSIFDEIQSVQNQGGLKYLESQISEIGKQSEKMEEKLKQLEERVLNDKEDDDKCRILYGSENWKRNFNPEFVNKCKLLRDNLNIGKNLDFQIRKKIIEKTKYYELFSLPKHVIEARIPTNIDQTKLSELSSNQALKFSIDKLNKDKFNLTDLIRDLYTDLYYHIPLADFQNVHLGKTTEKMIWEEKKKKYEPMFEKISEINSMIKTDFIDIESKYNEYVNACGNLKHSENEETQQYLNFLSNAKTEFQKHITNINNSLKFYESLGKKIQEITNDFDNYLISRDNEKKKLIELISKNERAKLSQNSLSKENGNIIQQQTISNQGVQNTYNPQNQYNEQRTYTNQGNTPNQNFNSQPFIINNKDISNNSFPNQNNFTGQGQDFQYNYQYNYQNDNNQNNLNNNQNKQLRYSDIFKK